MTPELTALALAALLQAVQFTLFAVPANKELTPGYTSIGPRQARLRGKCPSRTAPHAKRATQQPFRRADPLYHRRHRSSPSATSPPPSPNTPPTPISPPARLYVPAYYLRLAAMALRDLGRGLLRNPHDDRGRPYPMMHSFWCYKYPRGVWGADSPRFRRHIGIRLEYVRNTQAIPCQTQGNGQFRPMT